MNKKKRTSKMNVQFLPINTPVNEFDSNLLMTQLMVQALIIGSRIDKNSNTYSTIETEKTDEN